MNLNAEQLKKYEWAIGDGSDFPKMTDDPIVNHAIDMSMDDELPEWDRLDELERAAYIEEAKAAKAD